jgi:(p)ppGpp synthase/HD superfamily hydrolase
MVVQMYNKKFYSLDQITSALQGKVNCFDINKIVSAYEMMQEVYENRCENDGIPYFHHSTRVCGIILDELNLYDTDLIISCLLHDIYESEDLLSEDIIDYNFGPYVAFLLDLLNVQKQEIKQIPKEYTYKNSNVTKIPGDDILILALAEQLEKMRSLDNTPQFRPHIKLKQIDDIYLPLANISDNVRITYLKHQIVKEKNKIVD